MRVKNVRKTKKNLHDAMDEFIAYKKAQKLLERTVADYLPQVCPVASCYFMSLDGNAVRLIGIG